MVLPPCEAAAAATVAAVAAAVEVVLRGATAGRSATATVHAAGQRRLAAAEVTALVAAVRERRAGGEGLPQARHFRVDACVFFVHGMVRAAGAGEYLVVEPPAPPASTAAVVGAVAGAVVAAAVRYPCGR